MIQFHHHLRLAPRIALMLAAEQAARCDAILLRGGSANRIFAGYGRHKPLLDGNDAPSGAELVKLAKDLKAATDEVKKFAEKSTTEMKNLGDVTKETKDAADKALTEMNTQSARLTEIEQRLVRRAGEGAGGGVKSIGQLVVDDPEVKSQLAGGKSFKGRLNVEVKTITSASGGGSRPAPASSSPTASPA